MLPNRLVRNAPILKMKNALSVIEMLHHRTDVVDRDLRISLCKGLSNRPRQIDG